MSLLKEGDRVGKYTVAYLIKENLYSDTYRVTDDSENNYFLKVFLLKNLPAKLMTNKQVNEITFCKQLKHRNIISYVDSGEIRRPQGLCEYMVTTYFNGPLLSELIAQKGKLGTRQAKRIFVEVLLALKFIHEMPGNLLHNDITPSNIMLSRATRGVPEIIDLGHMSGPTSGTPPFDISDLDPRYCANQTFIGVYDESSDVFSASAVLYAMLTGHAPWDVYLNPDEPHARQIERVKEARQQALDLTGINDSNLRLVLKRGLALSAYERYQHVSGVLEDLKLNREDIQAEAEDDQAAKELLQLISQELEKAFSESEQESDEDEDEDKDTAHDKSDVEIKKGTGNGFSDIAGMEELKERLRKRVIFLLKDKETAEKYRLKRPNGMLLYGPPGCGKSFFAEKFADETEFNFMLVKASDVGSTYIHGSQGKIADLFKKAEKNAPTIICFDEFDAFVPKRGEGTNDYQSNEVNEFLSQLNNCNERGIFVIATSNRPDKIDPAVLRTGRIDMTVYVPMPDVTARKGMLMLHMKDRPCEEIDYDALAQLTQGYVSSDLTFVVNEAATVAAFNKEPITQELLERTIKGTKPSVGESLLKEYERLHEQMEGINRENSNMPPVGYVRN